MSLRPCFFLVTLAAAFAIAAPLVTHAAMIFESGTLGPTGVTWDDLTSQTVPGSNVSSGVFNGVRFRLATPVVTSQIGGHFVASSGGTFFGAIVALDGIDDFPGSGDLSTPDVIGATLLEIPVLSDEVYGDIALSLEPGWYALVFGSGLFGATTNGGAVRNGMDVGDPAYIGFQPGFGWSNRPSFFDNKRFVVKGQFVPEPSGLFLLLTIGTFGGAFVRCRPRA